MIDIAIVFKAAVHVWSAQDRISYDKKTTFATKIKSISV